MLPTLIILLYKEGQWTVEYFMIGVERSFTIVRHTSWNLINEDTTMTPCLLIYDHLARPLVIHQDVPGSKISVYKALLGQVLHTWGNLTTETEEQWRSHINLFTGRENREAQLLPLPHTCAMLVSVEQWIQQDTLHYIYSDLIERETIFSHYTIVKYLRFKYFYESVISLVVYLPCFERE